MNKVSKGLVLVLASALMGTAFASTYVTTGDVNAAAALGQAGQGNQAGLLNQSGKNNQTGLVNNQANGGSGVGFNQQGLFNTQRNQSNGNITSSQDGNKQVAIGNHIGSGSPFNNISNSNTNVNVQ